MRLTRFSYRLRTMLVALFGAALSLGIATAQDDFRVVIALHADIAGANPMHRIGLTTDNVFGRNVFEGLVHFGPDLEIETVLAESYTIIDDLTWEFALRQGVTFSNGAQFTATDVKTTMNHLLDETNDWQRRIQLVDVVADVQVIDDHTVRIVTKEPDPIFLTRLVRYFFVMPTDHLVEHSNEYIAANPIGTGPYVFRDWRREERVLLERNEAYWGLLPEATVLEWRIIPDATARLAALRAGEVDIVPEISVDSIDVIERDPNAYVSSEPSVRYIYVGLDAINDTPFRDRRVRQAVNYAVNVPEIVDAILGGNATPLYGLATPFNAQYAPDRVTGYDYNPERAIELLAEAGYRPEDLRLTLHSPRDRYIKDAEVAQAIAIQLGQLGIQVAVQFNEWGTHLQMIQNREASDMWLLGGSDTTLDAVELMYYRSARDMPWINWYDPEYEARAEAAMPIVDPDERLELAVALQQDHIVEAPAIYLYQQFMFGAVSNRIDWSVRADEAILGFLIRRAQ